jgi:hypothetical protein
MENGMFVELCGQSCWRDRLLFICQATVPALTILMTTVSCSRPDMPEPRVGVFEPLFLSPVAEPVTQPLVEREKEQPKVQRVQPRIPTTRKVATVHVPKTTGVSRPASKKANTPPQTDAQREQQKLFQEFLEWRRRQKDPP